MCRFLSERIEGGFITKTKYDIERTDGRWYAPVFHKVKLRWENGKERYKNIKRRCECKERYPECIDNFVLAEVEGKAASLLIHIDYYQLTLTSRSI